jgi:RNA polymerase sigma factor (sigma-70 family)
VEVSALRYSGGIGLHARSPLLRLQSDERLVALIRRGSSTAFEVLVARYHSRLLAFCRHLLGSREDAEDVLQEVFSAAFNAILDDDRPINVRPWLYRIARNRSLNHLRRIQAVGVDSMDIHLFDHGATTADKVHEREEFRLLVGDIQCLPETQRTALVLREMDALSYEQIAEAMETTVPSVKSLLVRARVSLAEASQARMLTCEDVRMELGEVAEGLRRRPSALVRRHLRTCERCSMFKGQLNETSKALTALLPIGFAPMFLLRKLAILHLGHSAGAGSGASGAGAASAGAASAGAAGQAAAVGSTAAAGATAVMTSTGGGVISAGIGAVATKAAAGLAAAALVTAGAVEVDQPSRSHARHNAVASQLASPSQVASVPQTHALATTSAPALMARASAHRQTVVKHPHKPAPAKTTATTAQKPAVKPATKPTTDAAKIAANAKAKTKAKPKATVPPPGRTQTQTDATVLPAPTAPTVAAAGTAGTAGPSSTSGAASTTPASTTAATTTTTPAPQSSDPSTTTTTTPTSTTPAPSSDPCTADPAGSTCAPASGGQPAPSGGVAP